MRLKTKNVYIYYDFPIVFSAANEEGKIFICLFADETDSYLRYFCKEISPSLLTKLEDNEKDIRSVYENPGKLYTLSLNAQSEEPIEAVETLEDIVPFLPEKGFFIGTHETKLPQTSFISTSAYEYA